MTYHQWLNRHTASTLRTKVSNGSPLTYRGALAILGHQDRSLFEKLDRLLGMAIMGGGVVAGVVALMGSPAPLIALSIWGWVDQKNEAIKLLRRMIERLPLGINTTSGLRRRQMVAAAHTAITVDAYIEALRGSLGEREYRALAITNEEKEAILKRDILLGPERMESWLYDTEVPAPSAGSGFQENISEVRRWLEQLGRKFSEFFDGLAAWRAKPDGFLDDVLEMAVENYIKNYTNLAREVPEFYIWANLTEHAATRVNVREANAQILDALAVQGEALVQLRSLLAVRRPPPMEASHGAREALARANQGALFERILATGAPSAPDEVSYPTIEEIYVDPRYRHCRFGGSARIGDEGWWEQRPVLENISVFIAAHLAAPDASSRPLVVLGHPGAGKSLLTKVLAARLPDKEYTTVRVPLRQVSAGSPIFEQVQQALDIATNARVKWSDVAESGRDTVRVLVLDGLDELLQAAPSVHHLFFRSLAEFQRTEEAQGLPIVVIVTSRTIVADQVDIPSGTPVIKIEPFGEAQIERWLKIWNEANQGAIRKGLVMPLAPESAMAQPDLATQPLLLLMLATYAADPNSVPLDSGSSTAALYTRVMLSFSRREISKTYGGLRPHEVEEAVEDHLWSLAVAAFAMFNRGQQYAADFQVGADMAALGVRPTVLAEMRDSEIGQRIAGQFFFIHSAEAVAPGRGGTVTRMYEFLHATFGEFLVARAVVKELMAISEESELASRRRSYVVDDDLLYTLLCCQPLTNRQSALQLATQLVNGLEADERRRICAILDDLIRRSTSRRRSERYSDYRPAPDNVVRALAIYSLNLVAIRAAVSPGLSAPLVEMFGNDDPANSLAEWRLLVRLWESVLELGSWESVLSVICLGDGEITMATAPPLLAASGAFTNIAAARLLGDRDLERTLRFGVAALQGATYYLDGDHWEEAVLSSLLHGLFFSDQLDAAIVDPAPPNTSAISTARVGLQVAKVLKLRARRLKQSRVEGLVRFLISLPDHRADPYALAAALLAHPSLAESVPELLDPERYRGGGWGLWFVFFGAQEDRRLQDLRNSLARLIPAVPEGPYLNADEARIMLQQVLGNLRQEVDPLDDVGSIWRTQKSSEGTVAFPIA